MKLLDGEFNTVKVFTDNIEESAEQQLNVLANLEHLATSRIRVMPDVHAGVGCTIGTTMTINKTTGVCPNTVGVDIGCGVSAYQINMKDTIDLEALDKFIHGQIPSGRNQHKDSVYSLGITDKLLSIGKLGKTAYEFDKQLGTLGNGNHFIEVDVDPRGDYWLVVHSGSRNLGKRVADYYQELAVSSMTGTDQEVYERKSQALIEHLKLQGRSKEINSALKKLKVELRTNTNLPEALCYLVGEQMANYLYDMKLVQKWATLNRELMLNQMVVFLGARVVEEVHSMHNYIDVKARILRKGAIDASLDRKLIIPMNMRDGSLICIGKGNADWNYSAPHGAGRLMSRGKARQELDMHQFDTSMTGIYSSTVNEYTIDEAPMAYKPMDEIVKHIEPTADILFTIKPIYNFKASE